MFSSEVYFADHQVEDFRNNAAALDEKPFLPCPEVIEFPK